MNKKRYIANKEWFQSHRKAQNMLRFLYKALPLIMVAVVPVMIIVKAFMGIDRDFLRLIFVPLVVLAAVTIMRKIINKSRPYEVYDTEPVINRDGKGESFPSRHTASAFIIAMCAIPVSVPLAVVLLIISVMIGLTRIFAGVHFISDVIMGALISVLTGLVFFVIL
ncbi:MAG: phosphatase PAP2 family protein [Ruminococcus sp.]|nr:phosphatase PAP2 family protein [Ruminococcus sp.]